MFPTINRNGPLRRVLRYILFALAIVFFGLSCLMLLSEKQISKNRLELADMRERVEAVKKFQKERGRLPNDEELSGLSATLPVRYVHFQYRLVSTPKDCPIQIPGAWPSGGWVMWFWRGEWFEHYSSWDDHYSLAEQASWWGFCGIMMFSPAVAALLFAVCFTPIFRK